MAALAVTYANQPPLPQRGEEEWGKVNAAERAGNESDLTFADPYHAEEDIEEDDAETVEAKTVAPLVEQRAEESAALTTPPNLRCPKLLSRI